MRVLSTADETYGSHAVAACVHAVFGRLDEFGVIGQTKVVVRTEVNHFLTAFDSDTGGLRRDDHAFVFIETCLANVSEG